MKQIWRSIADLGMIHYQHTANFKKLKEFAERTLREGSTLKFLILSEPDVLPYEEAMIKVQIYLKLLYREFGPTRT